MTVLLFCTAAAKYLCTIKPEQGVKLWQADEGSEKQGLTKQIR